MAKETVIETGIARTLIVRDFGESSNLQVVNTDTDETVWTHLSDEHSTKLADALLGENATVITDLPEAKLKLGYVEANGFNRRVDQDADELMVHIKAMLSIHAFLVKRNEEQEAEAEAANAKEAAKVERRDELADKFGTYVHSYDGFSTLAQRLVDHIIELEEAAKVS